MITLGIETSCDETAISVVKEGRIVLSNVVASSADLHAQFGGVFPEYSSRRHTESIVGVLQTALEQAKITPEEIDLIAVAKGPGLVGPLLVGMQFAKGLSLAWNKPFIGVSHTEAHLYAAMMDAPLLFPALGLVLSGGHTLLVKINDVGGYELIGTTIDDAIGEAFDKVAVLLGLSYPGGPQIEKLAKDGSFRFPLTAGKVKERPLDFSFSGLKTSVLYTIKGQNGQSPRDLSLQEKKDLAFSFQETALTDVVKKALLASQQFPCQAIYLGGGVCNNRRLQELFLNAFPEIPAFFPKPELTTDNGAMIAGLGREKFLRSPHSDSYDLEVQTRIPIA